MYFHILNYIFTDILHLVEKKKLEYQNWKPNTFPTNKHPNIWIPYLEKQQNKIDALSF